MICEYLQTVYTFFPAEFQVVHTVRKELGDMPKDTRELKAANFIGPTLMDLGLYAWMEKNGGLVSSSYLLLFKYRICMVL